MATAEISFNFIYRRYYDVENRFQEQWQDIQKLTNSAKKKKNKNQMYILLKKSALNCNFFNQSLT
jgi:hypothetical protein